MEVHLPVVHLTPREQRLRFVTFETVQMAGCDLYINRRFDPQFCMLLLGKKKDLEMCRYIEMQKNRRPSI